MPCSATGCAQQVPRRCGALTTGLTATTGGVSASVRAKQGGCTVTCCIFAAGNKRKADVARKDLWGGPGGGDGELLIECEEG